MCIMQKCGYLELHFAVDVDQGTRHIAGYDVAAPHHVVGISLEAWYTHEPSH